MNFEVLIDQDIFKKIPKYRIKQIKHSIKELKENPYPVVTKMKSRVIRK
jgi:hypothetical protein